MQAIRTMLNVFLVSCTPKFYLEIGPGGKSVKNFKKDDLPFYYFTSSHDRFYEGPRSIQI